MSYAYDVFRRYRAMTSAEVSERTWSCERCGARGEAVFHASGTHLQEEHVLDIISDRDSIVDGDEALLQDSHRTLAYVKCPTCGRRARGAVGWAVFRTGFWAALGAALLTATSFGLYVGPVFVILAVYLGAVEVNRAKRAGGAVIRKLVPGKLPEPKALPPPRPIEAPPPVLPEARALRLPAPAEPEPPRDPSDGPRFLR